MPSKRLIKDPIRYKTVLCATWASTGRCPYNRKCQFAHGDEELRQRTAPSPPEPQLEQGMTPSPMMLPVPCDMTASSIPRMTGLPVSHMGQWGACGLCAPTAPSPPMPASSDVTAQTSAPGMPPLPPGPPPPLSLPQTLPQIALAAAPAALQGARRHPLPPPPLLPAIEMREPSLSGNVLGKTKVVWEPLRCNEITGKIEPVLYPPVDSFSVPYRVDSADSPLMPTLARVGQQVSYTTQIVRRTISFVLENGPNTAIAA